MKEKNQSVYGLHPKAREVNGRASVYSVCIFQEILNYNGRPQTLIEMQNKPFFLPGEEKIATF